MKGWRVLHLPEHASSVLSSDSCTLLVTAAFFGIGYGANEIVNNNNDHASSVSSEMAAVEFTALDNGGSGGGGAKSVKAKSKSRKGRPGK